MFKCLGLTLVSAFVVVSCSSKKKGEDPPTNPAASASQKNETSSATTGTVAESEDIFELPALPSDLDAPLPLNSKVVTGKLDNGLTYYILPNVKPEKRAEFWMSINAGSFQEDDDQQGLAHFLEHMAFNGTKSFPKNELIAKLEALGVDFGAHLNAVTSFDETIYKLQLPTADESSIDLGIQILSEWLSGISFEPEEFEKERGVILAEKRSSDGAQQRLMETLIGEVLAGTRYANRLPIGKPEIVKKAPLAAIRRFYRDWYHPANAAVYVVGDIDAKAIEKKIRTQFGSIAAAKSAREAPKRVVLEAGELKVLSLSDAELPMTAVALGRFEAARPQTTANEFRAEFIDAIASVMLSKRMAEAQARGDVSFLVGAAVSTPMLRGLRVQAALAMLDPAKVGEGTRDLLRELERAKRHGFTPGEFDRAVKEVESQIKSAYKDDQDGKETSSSLVDELTKYHLSHSATPGRPMELALVRHYANELKLEELNQVFADILDEKGLVVANLGASGKGAFDKAAFQSEVGALASAILPPHADKPSTTELITTLPTPGTIAEKKHDKELDVHTWTLGNGATVHLKKTDFKGDEILFRAHSFGGTHSLSNDELLPLMMTAELVQAGGAGSFDAVALERALAGRDVGLSSYVSRTAEGMGGSSGADDVEALLQLIHLRFTAARKDEKAAGILKDTTVATLKQHALQPEREFAAAMSKAISNKNPRHIRWDYQTANTSDLDKSFAFYQERMSNAGDFHFYFVGSIDLAVMETLVAQYLSTLPDEGRREEQQFHAWPHNAKRVAVTVTQGSQDRASINLAYVTHVEPNGVPIKERLALDAFSRAARMQVLKIFREELGESYGATVDAQVGDTSVGLTIGLQSSPKAAKKIAKQLEREIQRLFREGVSEEHFINAKESMGKGQEVLRKSNRYWLDQLVLVREGAVTKPEILAWQSSIDALTSGEVTATMAKYFDPKRPVVGMLLPTNKGKNRKKK